MFLSITAGAGFTVLDRAVGDTGVIVAGAGVATGAVRTVVRTVVRAELLSGAAFIDVTWV